MRIVSNDSLVVDSSETEPILSQIAIVEESEDTSRSTEITASEDCLETAGDLPSAGAGIQFLSHGELSQCRICLDSEGEDLIAPCHCKGTQKYVHRSCLDNWRSTKEGFAFAHCTECRAKFILRANVPPDRWWLRLKFQFLVARDHAFIFLIVQLIVAFLGVLVYKFYGDELREMFGYREHPYAFYTMAVLAIVLVGLLYGFFIAIICGQRISERHYHVLAKKELTKVLYLLLRHRHADGALTLAIFCLCPVSFTFNHKEDRRLRSGTEIYENLNLSSIRPFSWEYDSPFIRNFFSCTLDFVCVNFGSASAV